MLQKMANKRDEMGKIILDLNAYVVERNQTIKDSEEKFLYSEKLHQVYFNSKLLMKGIY